MIRTLHEIVWHHRFIHFMIEVYKFVCGNWKISFNGHFVTAAPVRNTFFIPTLYSWNITKWTIAWLPWYVLYISPFFMLPSLLNSICVKIGYIFMHIQCIPKSVHAVDALFCLLLFSCQPIWVTAGFNQQSMTKPCRYLIRKHVMTSAPMVVT